MKRIIPIAAAFALALVAGCSSVPAQQADNDSAYVCDYARMARLERMAKEERAELRWVNCPQIARERAKTS